MCAKCLLLPWSNLVAGRETRLCASVEEWKKGGKSESQGTEEVEESAWRTLYCEAGFTLTMVSLKSSWWHSVICNGKEERTEE